ncbi:hypothetical protein [Thalassobius sp. I31.1]|uniref:hypothetical protein n=1 Tax=Thalassobius sp. I31.1 TaxID=2109912 RepID=UPI000D19908A|nr:hypothetical protein [Thalassobius sp. I31.1]
MVIKSKISRNSIVKTLAKIAVSALMICLPQMRPAPAAQEANYFSQEVNFMKHGMLLNDLEGRLSPREMQQYRRALEKFPTPDSCLSTEDTLDWSRISGYHDLEVCIFYLTHLYPDPQSLLNWFAKHGLAPELADIYGNWPTDQVFVLHVGIPLTPEVPNSFIPESLFSWDRLTASSLSLGISYSEDQLAQDINLTFNRK